MRMLVEVSERACPWTVCPWTVCPWISRGGHASKTSSAANRSTASRFFIRKLPRLDLEQLANRLASREDRDRAAQPIGQRVRGVDSEAAIDGRQETIAVHRAVD